MRNLFRALLTVIIVFKGITVNCQQTGSTPQFKREFLENINQIRQKGCTCGGVYMPPAPPLIWNDQLEIAAISHARDMANKGYFSHTSNDGRTVQNRVVSAGYTFKGYRSFTIGENIAQGQQSIDEVMKGWIKSAGHCKNLMNPAFREVGAAVYDSYWVQDFGGREPFTAEEQKLIKSGRYKLIQK